MPSRKVTRPDDGRISANRTRRTPVPPKTRMQKLIDGDIKPGDLDDEEILRGRCRDKNGNFGGRDRHMYPKKLLDAMNVEFSRRTQEKLNNTRDVAIQTLLEIAGNSRAAAQARVTAANILLERVHGKVPDKIQQTVEIKKFEEDFDGLLVDTDEVRDELAERRRRTG